MQFRLLGPVEIRAESQVLDAGHGRQRAMLAVLLLELGHVVPAEVLIDRIWDSEPPASARNVLSGHVTRLRAAVAGDPGVSLSRRAGGYLLAADPDQVDVSRFRALTAQAAVADGDEQAATLLRDALGLWHGPALAGLRSRWLDGMRDALERERASAVLALTDVRLRLGDHHALAAELAGQAAAAPADERLAGQLMLALYRSGEQAEALRWFEKTREHLADELGAHPGPQLRTLHQQILRADPALALPASGSGGGPGSRVAGPVPRQLPADVAAFTGRANELAALDLLLRPASDGPGEATAAVISAVSGTAGIGKTALAVHWAHQVADLFADGQLYVNLRGYDPGQPVTAAEALAGFLRALGVPGRDIPAGEDERAARYRSLLAGTQMLILLDNAADEQQVRPLLPASPASLVIVTSRSQLAGLAATDGAQLITLDVLSHAEAVQLLTARLGGNRAAAEPAAVDRIAGLCACLPLALAIAAARAATRPGFPLTALAGELADTAGRLDALEAGDPATSVRAVFSWSTRQLSQEAARMFRLLGLHPGPDISVPAAASLDGCPEPQARRLLRELARAHLITEHAPSRYAFHDLLRAYAADQACAFDSQDDRDAAIDRVLDHYLHTAALAALLLDPAREPVVLDPPRPGAAAGQPADSSQALAWFEAEHQVLLAAVNLAAQNGSDSHAWQLPWATADFMYRRGHWQENVAIQRTALAAATRLEDTAAQALAGRLLANACAVLGDLDQARGHFASSLTLYQRLGNRLGQARIQQGLAVLAERQGRYADALRHSQQALLLYQAMGDQRGEANALNNVGYSHALLGDYQQAREFCRQAIPLCAQIGNRALEGNVWDSLGYAEHHLGNLAEAAACYQRALSLYREAGDRFLESVALTHLGDMRHAAGELPQAQKAWQQALTILDDLKHPNAGQVRAKLASTAELSSTADHTSPTPSA
jgi:DNA-binding SARP family transcriptional activator/tetratricopeptide (TPR) repeat protein